MITRKKLKADFGDQTFTQYVKGAPKKDIYDYLKGIPSKEGGPLTEEDLASKDTKDTILKGYTPTQIAADVGRGRKSPTSRATRKVLVNQAVPKSETGPSKAIPSSKPRRSATLPASVARRSAPLPARTGR